MVNKYKDLIELYQILKTVEHEVYVLPEVISSETPLSDSDVVFKFLSTKDLIDLEKEDIEILIIESLMGHYHTSGHYGYHPATLKYQIK